MGFWQFTTVRAEVNINVTPLPDTVRLTAFAHPMNRSTLYWSANLCFDLAVLGGSIVSGDASGVHPVYLILLFALCSAPLLFARSTNDRYGLLTVFGGVYFVFFGVLDSVQLLLSPQAAAPASDGVIGADELVILAGGAAAQLGYHVACNWGRSRQRADATVRDWPEASLILWGTVIWAVSTWITWQLRVHVLVDTSLETTARGFGSMSPLKLEAVLLAGYMQPMGIVILAYAYCVYRRPFVLLALLGTIAVQMVFGFVTDSKGQVLIGVIIVVFCKLLVDGKLPKAWLGFAAAFIVVVFPVLQANRIAMGLRGTVHSEAAQDIGTTLARALETQESVSSGRYHAETFFERSSMKHSVAMIVNGTGNTQEFQRGHTLAPLLTAFIPRSLWPDKPDVQTGQLVNKEFHVSDEAATNISPSHLGELYWNFGWLGVLAGMPVIGALLGFIAAGFDLTRAVTLTRVLVLIATIKLLILGFEGVINVEYTVWMRTMAAIGLLHLVFARARAGRRNPEDRPGNPSVTAAPAAGPRYPNLLA